MTSTHSSHDNTFNGRGHIVHPLYTSTAAYRIAGNFSEIETLTIFASRHKNAKVSPQQSGSNNNIEWATSSANWSDRESMNREN